MKDSYVFRFAGGVVVGLAIFAAGFVAWGFTENALRWRNDPLGGQWTQVRLSGAEASRRGAELVEIGFEDRRVQEGCRGTCDDLVTVGAVERLRLGGADGKAIVERTGGFWQGARVSGEPLEAAVRR